VILIRTATALTTGFPELAAIRLSDPDYATTDVRLTRRLFFTERVKLDLIIRIVQSAESRQKRVLITQDGLESDTADFVKNSNLE
jgi:hypothetical protein